CVALPATLLFRSHYRAYPRGRVLLGVAFVFALPFLIHESYMTTRAPLVPRVGAGLALLGALSALFAFMPSPTTSMTVLCAQALTALVSLDLGLRHLYAPRPAGAQRPG